MGAGIDAKNPVSIYTILPFLCRFAGKDMYELQQMFQISEERFQRLLRHPWIRPHFVNIDIETHNIGDKYESSSQPPTQ